MKKGRWTNLLKFRQTRSAIAVITVVPMGKASFVYSYGKRRLMGQYNGKWSISLVYALKLLITVIRAISGSLCEKHINYDNFSNVNSAMDRLYWPLVKNSITVQVSLCQYLKYCTRSCAQPTWLTFSADFFLSSLHASFGQKKLAKKSHLGQLWRYAYNSFKLIDIGWQCFIQIYVSIFK